MRASCGELDAVDDVAAIARQLDAVDASRSARSAAWRTGRRCGRPSPPASAPRKVSTTAICRKTRKKSRMLLAPCSAKLSAQSPPCSRKASPAADARQRFLQVARLAGKNQRRKGRKLRLDVGQPWRRDNCGTCTTGLPRQLSGVQRSGMTLTPEQKPLLMGGCEGRVIHRRVERPPQGIPVVRSSPCGKS